jgi:transcriptional regulator with XRE-family HTH domain
MQSDRHPRRYGADVSLGRPGAVIRGARTSQGLTLAELGDQVGYSAAQVSRYERGVTPLTDIALLRTFAAALGIAPGMFGLTTAPGGRRHAAVAAQGHVPVPGGHTVDREQWEEDPVRRREMLTNTVILAGAAAFGAAPAEPGSQLRPDAVLSGRVSARPVAPGRLRAWTAGVREDFRAARYDKLPGSLPKLIATAQATASSADPGGKAAAQALLADAYGAAADFAVKVNDDTASWMLAGRALQAAEAGDDPLVLAEARRAVATAMRRAGDPGRATALLLRACQDIAPSGQPSPDELAVYGNLLNVLAYTEAVAGNRGAAAGYITEAAQAATRLGTAVSVRMPAFNPAGVILYKVSIAQRLGDDGTAIEQARLLRPAADIPTAERRGRYWVDVARAYLQWGHPEGCYRALLAAEQSAPAEVRFRPPVHRMTLELLSHRQSNRLPGLREFARRTGMPST